MEFRGAFPPTRNGSARGFANTLVVRVHSSLFLVFVRLSIGAVCLLASGEKEAIVFRLTKVSSPVLLIILAAFVYVVRAPMT